MKENENGNIFNVLPLVNSILAFLIVVHHSFNLNVDYNAPIKNIAWFIERYFYNLSECSVPVFFFISSLLFYRNYDGSMHIYLYKLKKRFKTLMIPYIIFNTFGYLKHIIFGSSDKFFSLSNLIKSIVMSDTMPLWFIRELYIFIFLAPIIYLFKKNVKVGLLFSIVCSLLNVFGILKYRSFLYWVPIYLIGVYFSEIKILRFNITIKKNTIPTWLFFLIFIFSPLFLPNTTGKMKILGNFMFLLFRLYSVFVWIYIISSIESKTIKVKEYMKFSFWIYCVHFPIISLVTIVITKIMYGDSNFILIIRFIVTICLTFTISLILGMLIKKIMPKTWKLLNGGR